MDMNITLKKDVGSIEKIINYILKMNILFMEKIY